MTDYDPVYVAVATKFDVNFEVMELSVEQFRKFIDHLKEQFDGIPINYESPDKQTYEFNRAMLEDVAKSDDSYSEMVEIAHTILTLGDAKKAFIRVELG